MKLVFLVFILMFISACSGSDDKTESEREPIRKVEEKVIYGDDNRKDLYQLNSAFLSQLADSTVALMRSSELSQQGSRYQLSSGTYGESMSLCQSEPFYSQPANAFCSGALVGPDLILTAGHCIEDASDCQATRFVFGYGVKSLNQFPNSVDASEVYSCKKIIYRVQESAGADFAVIQLDRTVSNHRPLAVRRSGLVSTSDRVVVIGHPSGLPTKVTDNGKVRKIESRHFVTNLDTYGGNSGSAVFNAETGLIEGVLVRGETDFTRSNTGCMISNRCPEDSCRGEDVSRIDLTLNYIPELSSSPAPNPTPAPSPTPSPVAEYSANVNQTIPDKSTVGVSSSVQAAQAANGRKVEVSVRIKHTYIGDLIVQVTNPQGKTVLLHSRSGGSKDNLFGTFGKDLASAQSLSSLSTSSAGKWTLKAVDAARLDVGVLESWKLSFK